MLPTSVISICVTPRPVLLTWISHGNIKRPAGQYTFPRTHSHTHTHTHTERERLYHGTVLTNNRKESTDGLMVRTMVYFQNHVWRFVSVYVRMCVIGTGNQNDPYINVCVCERDSVSIIEKPTEGSYLFQMSCYRLRAGLEAPRGCSVMVECHRLDDFGGLYWNIPKSLLCVFIQGPELTRCKWLMWENGLWQVNKTTCQLAEYFIRNITHCLYQLV